MKSIKTYIILIVAITLFGCKKFLDRPPLTTVTDENAWTSEDNLRLYVNKYYPSFFVGYNTGFSYSQTPLMGYTFSDDIFYLGNQSNFNRAVPNSSIWSYTTVRSINIMINRMETRMTGILDTDAYNHWMGIARFFRGLEYADLVNRFGDVPYYDHEVSDVDNDDLYKPRTPRDEVMDSVYNDLKFALDNVRLSDGDQFVNRYVVAGFVSRVALFEGSWQKYYYSNNARATKFFQLAEEAGNFIISSGKFDIVTDFRTLFTSNTLAGNKDVILYRHYDPAVGILHAIASNNNLSESVAFGPTTALIKSFICIDGNAWENSTETGATDFTLSQMIKTRDSRLEATFYDKPNNKNRSSYWYINKFLPRSVAAIVEAGGSPPIEFTSSKNETDYPVFRYAEALLNWIEAKAELSTIGGPAVTQTDIDRSVNKIRSRPIAAEALAKGVQRTDDLLLSNMPNDPEKDAAVPALIWEIRRERRMEFAFEYSRFEDLKRWKKLGYMDTDANPDLLSGGWVNFSSELPGELSSAKQGKISVVTMAGTTVVYNGTNGSAMKGFYKDVITNGRLPFLNLVGVNPYLDPVGINQMNEYAEKGYTLTQTEGWPQN
ncbi:MAG: RagB/SusD family nutrient uptake outer membrane protein [Niabella sp.]